MRRFGLSVLLVHVSAADAKDLPAFDTTAYCRSYVPAALQKSCIDRENKEKDLLSDVIGKIPAAEEDRCVSLSKQGASGSYGRLAMCIMLNPNFGKGANDLNVKPAEQLLVPSQPSDGALAVSKAMQTDPPKAVTLSPLTSCKVEKERSITVKFHFGHNLGLGSDDPEVRQLQVFLNAGGSQVASEGPGSPGNEVDLFGADTKHALTQFQAAHGLKATGFFGNATRACVNGLAAVQQISPNGPTARTGGP